MYGLVVLIFFVLSTLITAVVLNAAAAWANADNRSFSRSLIYTSIITLIFIAIEMLFGIRLNLIGSIILTLGAVALFRVPSDMLIVFIGTVFVLNFVTKLLLISVLNHLF